MSSPEPPTTPLAITIVGHDRPGIIAAAAEALAAAEMNLEDSSMTRLRGHFAMTLVCAGEASADQIAAALQPLRADGLDVTVRPVAPPESAPAVGSSHLVTVHGADRLGIVARLAAEIAAVGGNITDLTTRVSGELYVLLAEVDLPAGVDAAALEAQVGEAAVELGVEAVVRPLERDEL